MFVFKPEVSITHGSTVGRSVNVWLHEESVEGLEGSDPDGFLGGLGDEHGVSDLGLQEDPDSLLRCLRAQRERVTRCDHRSLLGLPLCKEFGLHDLLIFS